MRYPVVAKRLPDPPYYLDKIGKLLHIPSSESHLAMIYIICYGYYKLIFLIFLHLDLKLFICIYFLTYMLDVGIYFNLISFIFFSPADF